MSLVKVENLEQPVKFAVKTLEMTEEKNQEPTDSGRDDNKTGKKTLQRN